MGHIQFRVWVMNIYYISILLLIIVHIFTKYLAEQLIFVLVL